MTDEIHETNEPNNAVAVDIGPTEWFFFEFLQMLNAIWWVFSTKKISLNFFFFRIKVVSVFCNIYIEFDAQISPKNLFPRSISGRLSFRMRLRMCDGVFQIQTVDQNFTSKSHYLHLNSSDRRPNARQTHKSHEKYPAHIFYLPEKHSHKIQSSKYKPFSGIAVAQNVRHVINAPKQSTKHQNCLSKSAHGRISQRI